MTTTSKRKTRELRRQFLKQAAFGAACFSTPGLFAEELKKTELTLTPRQTEGPFYPDKMPLDTDNDLLLINDEITPAVGTVTHLTGRVLDTFGDPVRNATIEIWQADQNGNYIHSRGGSEERDGNFQGYGRFLTGVKGEYYFRTIKPVAYRGRTPHIHVIVKSKGKRMLTTEMYIKGAKQNDGDPVLGRVRDKKARESVLIDFKPLKDSKAGEQKAHFEIVLGLTPEDTSDRSRLTRPPRRNG
jgi:protocatechuate 3,4-dioxygenase, beta subunit